MSLHMSAARVMVLLLLSAFLESAAASRGARKRFYPGYDEPYASVIVLMRHHGGLPCSFDDLAPRLGSPGDGTVITRRESILNQPLLRERMRTGDMEDLL